MEILTQSWPWYVAGPLIALTMFLLLYFGKYFGVSSNLRTMCAIGGGGKVADFFDYDWKAQKWNLVFIGGAVIGGFISHQYLMPSNEIALNQNAVNHMSEQLGFKNIGESFLPQEIFGIEALKSVKGILVLLIGGFFVGFGTRYAGGCTSGHAISGLSNLQVPSLIAVVGFFIGGLLMTHILLPIIY